MDLLLLVACLLSGAHGILKLLSLEQMSNLSDVKGRGLGVVRRVDVRTLAGFAHYTFISGFNLRLLLSNRLWPGLRALAERMVRWELELRIQHKRLRTVLHFFTKVKSYYFFAPCILLSVILLHSFFACLYVFVAKFAMFAF